MTDHDLYQQILGLTPPWHVAGVDLRMGVIKVYADWRASTSSAQEVQRRVLGYVREHTGRMRYQSLREQGYHIGSGVIEAGCKSVVQGRFKGMRWSLSGAQAMLQVRTAWSSSEQADFAAVARRATLSS